MSRSVPALLGLALLGLAVGCAPSPVGDPCVPETIPGDGFDSSEVYIETSSVQCVTRICMVYQLDGNPERIVGTPSCADGATDCITASQLANHVTCSCRCDVTSAADENAPLCNCPDGFSCEPVVTTGGAGVRGSYCVPCRYTDDRPDDRNLSDVFPVCPD